MYDQTRSEMSREQLSAHDALMARVIPLGGKLGDIFDQVTDKVNVVFEACSFQDITGQRTTKVINTLSYIETRVNTMIEIWGVDNSVLAPDGQLVSHRKLDDEFPEITEAFLQVLYPHYIQPFPSCTLLQMELSAEAPELTGKTVIPRHHPAISPAVGGHR